MTDGTREMTLDEVVDTLPPGHRARRDLALLHFTNDVLRAFRHSTQRRAENTYQQIDSFGVHLRQDADQRRGTGLGLGASLAGAAGWEQSNTEPSKMNRISEQRPVEAPKAGIYKGGSC